jgi:hypothetical protein
MKFGVTCDANIESGLNDVLNTLNNDGFDGYFDTRFYDDAGTGLFIVLMCRDPMWNFKQRIRFVKKRNTLYVDIMLDLDVMSRADLATRKRIIGEKIVAEVPQIVAKKKFKDFDLPRFTSDLREWFETHGWISAEFSEFVQD